MDGCVPSVIYSVHKSVKCHVTQTHSPVQSVTATSLCRTAHSANRDGTASDVMRHVALTVSQKLAGTSDANRVMECVTQVVRVVGTDQTVQFRVQPTVKADVKKMTVFVTVVRVVGTDQTVQFRVQPTVKAGVRKMTAFVTAVRLASSGPGANYLAGRGALTTSVTDKMAPVTAALGGPPLAVQSVSPVITVKDLVQSVVVAVLVMMSVTTTTVTVHEDVIADLMEIAVTDATEQVASDETQDGGNLAGPLVGGLLGAGALIGIAILLAAFIIRRRRSRDTSNSADTDGGMYMDKEYFLSPVHFSSGNAPIEDVTEGDKPETETPGNESNYAQLEKYENPDDIRPYSVLQDGGKLPKYLNIQSDQETALYQNTTVSKN
ncbi:hypothetical protein BaRGS_00022244 [Batillaria attramentaria]|uniref:Uncharacterized protein n=1 Tax=Batillaria attramentaria TaxID=370345 RepID=A0ABD0KH70_9CAEN